MSSDSNRPVVANPAGLLQSERIMYGALLFSHAVYAGLALYLPMPAADSPTPGNSLGTILAVISICAAGAALTLHSVGFADAQIDKWIDAASQKFKEPDQAQAAVRQRAMPLSLMRWSMASAASIMGLMTTLTGSLSRHNAVLFIALGALVHLYCQPRLGQVQARIAERASGSPL